MQDKNHIIPQDNNIILQDWNNFLIKDDLNFVEEFQNVVSDDAITDQDEIFTPDVFGDTYLNMEIALPHGGGNSDDTQFDRVAKSLQDAGGHPIVTANKNPLLDMHNYELEFECAASIFIG